MIKLDVQEYCHMCRNFEPTVDKLFSTATTCEQRVRCVYRDQCANVADRVAYHIRKSLEEKIDAETDPDAGTPWSYEIMKNYR